MEKENVVISAGDCSVTLLPELGGKIASIRVGEAELLQAPLAPLAPRTQTMGFDQADASGWDECLPSVAACTVNTPAGVFTIPDHGDLWRLEWSPTAGKTGTESEVSLTVRCFSLPLEVTRRIRLSETETGWRLALDYSVANFGSDPAPWSWAAHPLFAVEAGDRILLPAGVHKLRLEGSGGNRLGKGGETVNWPIAALASGGAADLSLAEGPQSGIGDKLFAGPLQPAENWCALERPKAGIRIKVSFSPVQTPYLGLWICYGGWPERPGPKQVCVALEPATAPVDSLAVQGPWSLSLAPGANFCWSMQVDFDRIAQEE